MPSIMPEKCKVIHKFEYGFHTHSEKFSGVKTFQDLLSEIFTVVAVGKDDENYPSGSTCRVVFPEFQNPLTCLFKWDFIDINA